MYLNLVEWPPQLFFAHGKKRGSAKTILFSLCHVSRANSDRGYVVSIMTEEGGPSSPTLLSHAQIAAWVGFFCCCETLPECCLSSFFPLVFFSLFFTGSFWGWPPFGPENSTERRKRLPLMSLSCAISRAQRRKPHPAFQNLRKCFSLVLPFSLL